MRHVLTMAIGVSPELRVHSYSVQPRPGELILISSDGLHGVLEPGVIAEGLSGNGSLEAKCQRLIEAAKKAGGPDNITVVLLRAQ
jgi:protein phosphatase